MEAYEAMAKKASHPRPLILQSPRRPCCQAGLTLAQAAEMRYEMLLEEILCEV